MQLVLGEFADRQQQLVGELAADRGADLRHLLAAGAEPVEPRHQRGLQRRRDRERGQRRRRSNLADRRSAPRFEHALVNLLDKQRHAVGALDDLGDDIGGSKRGVAGELLDQRRAVAPVRAD